MNKGLPRLSDIPSLVKKNSESVILKFTQYNSSSRPWAYPRNIYRYFRRYFERYKDDGSNVSYQVQIEGDNKTQISDRNYHHKNLQTDLEITVYGLQPNTWYNLSVLALFNIDNRNYPSTPSEPVLVQTDCAGKLGLKYLHKY